MPRGPPPITASTRWENRVDSRGGLWPGVVRAPGISPRAGTTAIAVTHLLADGRTAIGAARNSAASRSTPDLGLCRPHNHPWAARPDGPLALRQEVHRLGTAATALLVRTTTGCLWSYPMRRCSRSRTGSEPHFSLSCLSVCRPAHGLSQSPMRVSVGPSCPAPAASHLPNLLRTRSRDAQLANLKAATGAEGLSCFRDSAGPTGHSRAIASVAL
jgi:hypothetical protein